ncbi:MAG: hypothetical protein K6G22_08510 [Lachnospiraceae bacterium]|nr:hypothetical protein [Lachnospiraceae bacterium]
MDLYGYEHGNIYEYRYGDDSGTENGLTGTLNRSFDINTLQSLNSAGTGYYIRKYRSRRALERKRNMILIFILSMIIFVLVFSCFAYASDKKDSVSAAGTKCYKSVVIHLNDTLDTIAQGNLSNGYSSDDELVKEIISINRISADTALIPGNSLIVPYYR